MKGHVVVGITILVLVMSSSLVRADDFLEYLHESSMRSGEQAHEDQMQKRNLLTIVGIVLFVGLGAKFGLFTPTRKQEDPLIHLKERLARGEVTEEEFIRITQLIKPNEEKITS